MAVGGACVMCGNVHDARASGVKLASKGCQFGAGHSLWGDGGVLRVVNDGYTSIHKSVCVVHAKYS